MFKKAHHDAPHPHIDECYQALSKHSVAALCAQKTPNPSKYREEIVCLAKYCSVLMKNYSLPVSQVITDMETAINKAYLSSLEQIQQEIENIFNKRKKISAHTTVGEQEIALITIQMAELEQRKIKPSDEIIQQLIFDSLELACQNSNIELPDEIYINLYDRNNAQTIPALKQESFLKDL